MSYIIEYFLVGFVLFLFSDFSYLSLILFGLNIIMSIVFLLYYRKHNEFINPKDLKFTWVLLLVIVLAFLDNFTTINNIFFVILNISYLIKFLDFHKFDNRIKFVNYQNLFSIYCLMILTKVSVSML